MKANLPVFKKLFALLVKKCSLMRVACDGLEVPATSAAALTRLKVLLDSVTAGCKSLSSCLQSVLDELADDPKYLETHKDSIKEAESSMGSRPLMPLSSLMYYLQGSTSVDALAAARPCHSLGSDGFSLMYGTRGLLSIDGDLSLAKAVGMRDIMQKHNETTESEYHLDDRTVSTYSDNLIRLSRYLINGVQYRKALSLTPGNTLVNHLGQDLEPAANKCYGLASGLRDVVSITTNPDQRKSRMELVQIVEASDDTIIRGTRKHIRAMNLIDLNVVPINIHALMREIPLVNLYNYAYTFDDMVCKVLGVNLKDKPDLNTALANNTPVAYKGLKTMAWLMVNPLGAVSEAQFYKEFALVARGAVSLPGLGRPRYLADELYNKAFFGEMYGDFNAAGPGAAASGNSPAGFLRWMAHDDKTGMVANQNALGEVAIGANNVPDKAAFKAAGHQRFNTFFGRSLVWVTQLQRVLRLKLRRDLHWYSEKLVRDNAVLSSGITELYGNDTVYPNVENDRRNYRY